MTDLLRLTDDDFLYWEDIVPGPTYDLGAYEFTRAEILEMAARFDPQPFHTDEEAAAQSMYGGLIASGWHTAAVYMGLYARGFLNHTSSMGSPGVDNLRWLAPVRPGDAVRGMIEVVDTRPSAKHTNRGTVLFVSTLTNQDDVIVYRMEGSGFFGRRPTTEGAGR